MIALLRKLLSAPPLRSDRAALFVKTDGRLYFKVGSAAENEVVAGSPLPTGGVAGQVLKKTGPAAGDLSWSADLTGDAGALSGAWPIGSIFMSAVSTNPASLLGFGTWAAFGTGRMPIGVDGANTRWDAAEETGGAETVTLTEAQMPVHTHVQNSHNHTQDAHAHNQDSNTVRYVIGTQPVRVDAAGTLAIGGSTQSTTATNQAATATNQNAGSGAAHDNMPPYIAVYMWKRTA